MDVLEKLKGVVFIQVLGSSVKELSDIFGYDIELQLSGPHIVCLALKGVLEEGETRKEDVLLVALLHVQHLPVGHLQLVAHNSVLQEVVNVAVDFVDDLQQTANVRVVVLGNAFFVVFYLV